MHRKANGYEIRPVSIELAQIPYLEVVQIQPSIVDIENNDYIRRSKLINSIITWLCGSPSLEIFAGQPQSAATVAKKPHSPFLLSFPELYIPIFLLLELASAGILEDGTIIMGGICPLEEGNQEISFFDESQLISMQSRLKKYPNINFPNLTFLETLMTDIRMHGNVANMAATLIIDKNRRANLIFHSKLAPSKFERGLLNEETTIEASCLYPIELTASTGRNRSVTILPMICSDLFLVAQNGQGIIQYYDYCGRPTIVDLISIMSLQKTRLPDPDYPFPHEVANEFINFANGRYENSFKYSHLIWTNVGAFIQSGKTLLNRGGYSSLCIIDPKAQAEERPWLSERLKHWAGIVFLYGEVIESSSRRKYVRWFRNKDIDDSVKITKSPKIIIFTPDFSLTQIDASSIEAAGQILRFRLNHQVGPESIESGQVLWIKDEVFRANVRLP